MPSATERERRNGMVPAALIAAILLIASGARAVVLDPIAPGCFPGAGGISSQNFLDLAKFTQAADDFTVPPGAEWQLTGLRAIGSYILGPGPASTVDVTLFADAGGTPGAVIFQSLGIVPSSNQGGTLVVPLLAPQFPSLPAGTYWISVQANMSFVPEGQWHWTDTLTATGYPYVFRSSDDPNCAMFAPPGPPCFDEPSSALGLCFELSGFDLNGAAAAPALQPAPLAGALVFLVLLAGLRLRRRA